MKLSRQQIIGCLILILVIVMYAIVRAYIN